VSPTEPNDILRQAPWLKRLVWLIWLGSLLSGAGLVALSLALHPVVLRIPIFFLGSYTGCSALLVVLNNHLYFRVPSKYLKRYALFVGAWLTLGVQIIPGSLFRWYVLGGTAATFLVIPAASGMLFFMAERMLPLSMYKDYSKGWRGGRWGSMGLVLFEPGAGSRHGRRIMAQYRFATALFGFENAFMFFSARSIRRYPPEFERMLVGRVPALIVFRTPPGPSVTDFDATVDEWVRLSTGRVFVVVVTPIGRVYEPAPPRTGVETYWFTPSSDFAERLDIAEFASQLSTQLSTSAHPLGESDDSLSSELKELIPAIATRALSPVANCYLRFRTSRSNVERFLGSLDCIEVLVKLSAMYLLATAWKVGAETPRLRQLPTLGDWVSSLRSLVAGGSTDPLSQSLRGAWERKVSEAQEQLVTDAVSAGLSWTAEPLHSHLDWLRWFSWLRNVTRGHGSVGEDQVASLWHGLHTSFLHIASDLSSLILDSRLLAGSGDRKGVRMGWTREAVHLPDASDAAAHCEPVLMVSEVAGSNHVSLYPFIVERDGAVLLWNGIRRDQSAEYLEYGTGGLLRVPPSMELAQEIQRRTGKVV
jgi:hypothetical protein